MLSSFSNSVRFAMPCLATNRSLFVMKFLKTGVKDVQPAVSGRRRRALIKEGQHGVHSDVQNSPDSPVSQTEYTIVAIVGGETRNARALAQNREPPLTAGKLRFHRSSQDAQRKESVSLRCALGSKFAVELVGAHSALHGVSGQSCLKLDFSCVAVAARA